MNTSEILYQIWTDDLSLNDKAQHAGRLLDAKIIDDQDYCNFIEQLVRGDG